MVSLCFCNAFRKDSLKKKQELTGYDMYDLIMDKFDVRVCVSLWRFAVRLVHSRLVRSGLVVLPMQKMLFAALVGHHEQGAAALVVLLARNMPHLVVSLDTDRCHTTFKSTRRSGWASLFYASISCGSET